MRRAPRARRHLVELSLQSVLIVFSILLALAVDEWAEGRDRARRAEEALASFAREIRANRQRVVEVLPYHRALRREVARVDSLGTVRSYADWRVAVPSFAGFHPPAPTSTAWATAVATGALPEIDYGLVAELSSVYNRQEKLDAYSYSSLPLFDFSDPAMNATVRRAYVYLASVVPMEEALLAEYDRVLPLLARRRTD